MIKGLVKGVLSGDTIIISGAFICYTYNCYEDQCDFFLS